MSFRKGLCKLCGKNIYIKHEMCIPCKKFSEKRKFNEMKEKKGKPIKPSRATHPIYDSPRWLELRYKIFIRDGKRCATCGATNKQTSLHIDHVLPVSKYPALTFDESNLQVLCRSCNLGKSNIVYTKSID